MGDRRRRTNTSAPAKFAGRWDGTSGLRFNFMLLCRVCERCSGCHCEGTDTARPGVARGVLASQGRWPVYSEPGRRESQTRPEWKTNVADVFCPVDLESSKCAP